MRITLDGTDADITLDSEKTLSDVLCGLERALEEAGRSICAVTVDGEAVDAAGLEEAGSRPVEAVTTLDLATAGSGELVEAAYASLASLEEAVAEAAVRLADFSLDMQTGKDAHAAETVRLFTLTSQSLSSVYTRLGLESPVFTDFTAALREFLAAYEADDFILAGDLAEYELAPLLQKWYEFMKTAKEAG